MKIDELFLISEVSGIIVMCHVTHNATCLTKVLTRSLDFATWYKISWILDPRDLFTALLLIAATLLLFIFGTQAMTKLQAWITV